MPRSRPRSRSSSRSRSRSRSPSSRSPSSESNRSRSRSRSRSRGYRSDSGRENEATSPTKRSKSPRIPRKNEFASATDVVPPPPRVILSSSKERVRIAEAAKARFEELASGLFLPSEDRSNLIKELSFVNSSLALVPSIDDPLRATLYEKGVSVNMKLSDLTRLHETLLIGLNLRELIEKLGSDGQGSPLDSGVYGYLDVFARLNGAAIKDLIRLEREAVLRARGVNPYRAMPSLGRLPLDGSSFVHRSTNTVIPNLFGEVLRSELTTADSSASRALERLRRTDSGRANRNNSRAAPSRPSTSRTEARTSAPKRPPPKRQFRAPNSKRGKK